MAVPPLTPSASLRWPLIESFLKRVPKARSIVEVGAGQGAAAVRLADRYAYQGYEPDVDSCAVARSRLSELGAGTMVSATLPSEADPADILVAFEVLEHIDDDGAALAEWHRWVNPGGAVILSVPAHQSRFGPADEAVGHFRRYERSDLTVRLVEAGFTGPLIHVYGFPLGYLLERVRNRAASSAADTSSFAERTASSGRWRQPGGRWSGAIRLGTVPFAAVQRPLLATDLGTGFVAFATKPS